MTQPASANPKATEAGNQRWAYAFSDPLPAEAGDARHLLGGKGAGLAEMTRAGLNVPPGFIITTEAGRWFQEHDGRWPPGLEAQLREHLQRLEKATGRAFGRDPDRLLVSVRSGAAVSMPGMMDTVLNVGSGADAWPQLVDSINAVFRSWNSDRARAYRQRHHLEGPPGTAVTVQAMFPSKLSGVLFTQDPNQPEANRLVIEAAFGLGDAVVSGEVTPDRFLVPREDFARVEVFKAHDQPTLAPAQLAELCALALRVEAHYGQPMDLEWGWADGQWALFQCRPIRGLDVAQDVEACRQEEILRLRELAGKRRRLWVTHNLRETLRWPTPLTWDIVRHFMSGNGGFGRMYRALGYRPSREVGEQGFLELICGRIFADPERLAQLFWAGLPMRYDLELVRRNPGALNCAPTRFDPDGADGAMLFRLPGLVLAMMRSARRLKPLRADAKRHFDAVALPPYLDYVRSRRTQDLGKLSVPELLGELHVRRTRVLDEFGMESLKPGYFGGLALNALEDLLAQLAGPEDGARLAATLTMALEGDTTYEQNALLEKVAAGETPLSAFLEQFGHRCANEMELMEPRWREAPAYLHRVIEQLGGSQGRSLDALHHENAAKSRAAIEELPGWLEQWGGSSFREDIEEHLQAARALLPYRESARHYLMMGYELIRLVLLELGRRWGLGRDLFFLRLAELEQYESCRAELAGIIAQRKVRWQSAQRLELPDVIDSEHLETLGRPPATTDAKELQGVAVAAGNAAGPARIVFQPEDAGDLGTDYILVCPSTDPGWTPLFIHARGLVVERGGLLSHGAIVARDFGIPAVVLPGATRTFRNGESLRVDGNRGTVEKAWKS